MVDAALYERTKARLASLQQAARAATAPKTKLTALTDLLNAIGVMAANAPTVALRERWIAQYRVLQPQVGNLRAQVNSDTGIPGAVLQTLDKFSDSVLNFSQQVLDGVGGTIAAAPKVLGATPWLVVAALVLAAVVVVKVGPQLLKARR